MFDNSYKIVAYCCWGVFNTKSNQIENTRRIEVCSQQKDWRGRNCWLDCLCICICICICIWICIYIIVAERLAWEKLDCYFDSRSWNDPAATLPVCAGNTAHIVSGKVLRSGSFSSLSKDDQQFQDLQKLSSHGPQYGFRLSWLNDD